MNLHDMLSADDVPSVVFTQDEESDPFSALDAVPATPLLAPSYPPNNAYYLPTTLSRTQVELTEILLQLFKDDLLELARNLRPRTSIQSLLDDSSLKMAASGSLDKIDSLFDLLVKIARHPSLMVDHFMPKKLLLLMTNDLVIDMSGKFYLLNTLINVYTEQQTKSEFHMVIVALNTKELELVEGLIIGKPLVYTSLSNFKLFDHGPYEAKPGLNVHLVTSQQLQNNFVSFLQSKKSEEPFRLIFSLDLDLDVSSPSIDLIQSEGERVPIFIPIPIYSIEHLKHLVPPPTNSFTYSRDANDPLFKWKASIINLLIINRHFCFDESLQCANFVFKQYGPKMAQVKDCVSNKSSAVAGIIDEYNKKVDLKVLESKIFSELDKILVELQFDDVENCDLFKSALAQVSSRRVASIEQKTLDINKHNLVLKRQEELKRQLEIDEGIDTIAATFTKLRKTNEEAEAGERRLARAEEALLKAEKEHLEAKQRLQFLQSAELERSPALDLIERQHMQLKELQTEAQELESEYRRLVQEGENKRQKYQEKSAEAVSRAAELSQLTSKNETFSFKIKHMAPGALPDLARQEAVKIQEKSLAHIQHDNAFIDKFMEKRLLDVAKERQKSLGSISSTPTGRPNNRVSRALTPHG